jgi:two-component system capsular synthesis response regulator RcsB
LGPISVALADDHPLVLAAITDLLERQSEFLVAHISRSGQELYQRLETSPCSLIVTDFSMGREENALDGLDLIRRLHAQWPSARIVVLTALSNSGLSQRIIKSGASAIVSKEDDLMEVVTACRHTFRARSSFFSPALRKLIALQGARPEDALRQLTAREMEIIRLVTHGLAFADIAERFGVTVSTVATHKKNAMRKINVSSNADLIRFAYENGLIESIRRSYAADTGHH